MMVKQVSSVIKDGAKSALNVSDAAGAQNLFQGILQQLSATMSMSLSDPALLGNAKIQAWAKDMNSMLRNVGMDQLGNLSKDLASSNSNTTNNYNITLQGSNNANADVLSLVQMLGSLQGSATP
jgi:hypothetical protein